MDFGRIMQVNDRGLDDLVIRNVEINGVVGAEPRGAPVDLADFAVSFSKLSTSPDFVRGG